MPSIPFYCAPSDLPALLDLFGDDIAFIIADGDRRWRAVSVAGSGHLPCDGTRTALWHVPSGPLPLMGAEIIKPNGLPDVEPTRDILDPWSGWTEARTGANPSVPYFGAGHGGVFWLDLAMTGREPGSQCGQSSLGWIGKRYPDGAPQVTVDRWARLRRQIAKATRKAPLGGFRSGKRPTVFTFPHAFETLDIADRNPPFG